MRDGGEMNSDIQAFKANFDIVTVANDLGYLPPKKGMIHQGGNCPCGHESKEGRCFTVYPSTNSAYCFHCRTPFDVINLVEKAINLSFIESCNWLSKTYHQHYLMSKKMTPEERAAHEATIQEQKTIFSILTETARFYHEKLLADVEIKNHLIINHYGFNEETISTNSLGYSIGEGLLNHLLLKKFKKENIIATGLFVKKGNQLFEFFNNRLTFPYWNAGKVVYFIGRRTDRTPDKPREEAKYIKLPVHNEKHPYVSPLISNQYYYGEDSIRGQNIIYIAEGVTDCLALLQAGKPCISPVTVQFREADFPRLEKLTKNVQKIYLIPDNEENEAGIKGAMATADKSEESGRKVYIIELPRPDDVEKVDLNEFLRDHSMEDFNKLVEQAKAPWEIKIDRLTVPKRADEAIHTVRHFVKTELLKYDEMIVRAIIRGALKKKFSLSADDVKDLFKLWNEERREKSRQKVGRSSNDREPNDPLAHTCYQMKTDGFYYEKETTNGPISIHLSKFTAKVECDVTKDNGLEQKRYFEISGQLESGKPLPPIQVPVEKFPTMNWVMEWGVGAVVAAGMGTKDRVREVIQLVSKDALNTQVFTHIGWRKIDGHWIYLYSGGAIGRNDITVDPEGTLQHYNLAGAGDVHEGMRASLALLEIAPKEITLPLWAAVWRAPTAFLSYPTVVIWLYGITGSYKSTLGALYLSHYGGPFTTDNLPGSWLSTDNSLEQTASFCRDAMLLIDDYAPESNPREASRLDKRVNRLVRQVGNRAGRGRLRSDLTAKPNYIPNGLVVATGEQLPLGVSSVGARILPVLCEREKVDLSKLTEAQANVDKLSAAMRGFIEWLIPQIEDLRGKLHIRFRELRQKALINGHARLPEAVAHLQLGTELGLQYALSLGVITEEKAKEIEKKSWDVLLLLAQEHSRTLKEERPVVRFLQTLNAIFIQGKGHLQRRQSDKVSDFELRDFGWRNFKNDQEEGIFGPTGELLGWIDDVGLYLIPGAAFRAVNEYLRSTGGLPVREHTLRDALAQEKILIRGPDRRSASNLRMEGKAQRVLHLNKSLYSLYVRQPVALVAATENPLEARDLPQPSTGCSNEKPSALPGTANKGATAFSSPATTLQPVGSCASD